MRRAAQADGGVAAGGGAGHAFAARQDQGQRAGPEGVDQALREIGHGGGKVRHGGRPGHVHDQRVVGRAALGGKDGAHRRVVAGVGRQAVDRLGGQAEQLAGGEPLDREINGLRLRAVEHHQKASMPSRAAARSATARAASAPGAVSVR